MKGSLGRRVSKVRSRLRKRLNLDFVSYGGCRLPPPGMRYCGPSFRNDDVFLGSGKSEAQRLVRDFGLSERTDILEIGCGPGRLPIGLLAEHLRVHHYDGVDIDRSSIDWCNRHIARRHPAYRFLAVDAQHARYNPGGMPMNQGFRLPFDSDSYDLVYLHSVFANLVPDDISVYCREFARVLRPGGKVFLTAFIEEGVPDVTFNPQDYIVASSGSLNVARYAKDYFLRLVREAGLEVIHFGHRGDLGGQSVVHLMKVGQGPAPKTDMPVATLCH